jgi:uncharacterized protein
MEGEVNKMNATGSNPFSRRQPMDLDYGSEAGNPAIISFFNSVYAWMAAGLALTAMVAIWASHSDAALNLLSGPTVWIVFIAELVLVFAISAAIQRISAPVATVLFLIFAALNGLTLSGIFIIYAKATIVSAFIACAVMFGAMSLWGMFTRADLTSFGKILFMALIGVVVASVVNLFLRSPMMTWIISYVGVALFSGLTAYDTQRLRQVALSTLGDNALSGRLAISGALMLYLDFLNLFLFILQILGNSSDRRR